MRRSRQHVASARTAEAAPKRPTPGTTFRRVEHPERIYSARPSVAEPPTSASLWQGSPGPSALRSGDIDNIFFFGVTGDARQSQSSFAPPWQEAGVCVSVTPCRRCSLVGDCSRPLGEPPTWAAPFGSLAASPVAPPPSAGGSRAGKVLLTGLNGCSRQSNGTGKSTPVAPPWLGASVRAAVTPCREDPLAGACSRPLGGPPPLAAPFCRLAATLVAPPPSAGRFRAAPTAATAVGLASAAAAAAGGCATPLTGVALSGAPPAPPPPLLRTMPP